jgi:hypothetical protein
MLKHDPGGTGRIDALRAPLIDVIWSCSRLQVVAL